MPIRKKNPAPGGGKRPKSDAPRAPSQESPVDEMGAEDESPEDASASRSKEKTEPAE